MTIKMTSSSYEETNNLAELEQSAFCENMGANTPQRHQRDSDIEAIN